MKICKLASYVYSDFNLETTKFISKNLLRKISCLNYETIKKFSMILARREKDILIYMQYKIN